MTPLGTNPSRPYLALTAAWFALLAALFLWVLTPDSGDPTFRWLWGAGLALLPPTVACLLAAAAPVTIAQQSLWLAAQGMLLLSGSVSLLLLLTGLVMAVLQGAGDRPVLLHYGGALAMLAVTLSVFWFRLRTIVSGGPA